jgi:hypothetical protein
VGDEKKKELEDFGSEEEGTSLENYINSLILLDV